MFGSIMRVVSHEANARHRNRLDPQRRRLEIVASDSKMISGVLNIDAYIDACGTVEWLVRGIGKRKVQEKFENVYREDILERTDSHS